MFNRLIENWLINVHELGYQIPFCQVLLTEGHTVLHISRHGRGEHGKDIVTRDSSGHLKTYQLKGGDITLNDWRKIRGEVEELVQLPVMVPGIKRDEPHSPVLVINGEIRGDALVSIQQYAEDWEKRGYPRMEIIQKNELLKSFVDAHGTYLPENLFDFRKFVEFYVSNFYDRLPKDEFAFFLERLVKGEDEKTDKPVKTKTIKRLIESMILTASYVIEQYEKVENHISAVEGWSIVAATILQIAERENLKINLYKPSLDIVWQASRNNLENFEHEVLTRPHFVEPNFIWGETDLVRGARTLTSLAWIAGWLLTKKAIGEKAEKPKEIRDLILKQLAHIKIMGECDWAAVIILAIYLEQELGSSAGEGLIENWIRGVIENNSGEDPLGIPSPYWSQEKILAFHYGQLPPYEEENFSKHSYTIKAALNMLVRRLRRQQISLMWRNASDLTFVNYIPDSDEEWFRWRSDKGDNQFTVSQQPVSWSEWHRNADTIPQNSIPAKLSQNSSWLLPYCLTYPHRVNEQMSDFIDIFIGKRGKISDS